MKTNYVVLASLLVLSACKPSSPSATGSNPAGTPAASATKLTLTGSSTVAPLAAEIGKRFETQHPGVRVDVQTGGSSRGVADALSGLADIGDASRALKPEEISQGLIATTIAKDGICVILHKDNPVKELTKEQIVSIYLGKVTDWKQVGSLMLAQTEARMIQYRRAVPLAQATA